MNAKTSKILSAYIYFTKIDPKISYKDIIDNAKLDITENYFRQLIFRFCSKASKIMENNAYAHKMTEEQQQPNSNIIKETSFALPNNDVIMKDLNEDFTLINEKKMYTKKNF